MQKQPRSVTLVFYLGREGCLGTDQRGHDSFIAWEKYKSHTVKLSVIAAIHLQ